MQQLGVTKPARRREKFSLLPPAIYLVQMFFFARPPSCATFTRLLAFRVTRKSQRYNTRNLTFIFGARHSFGPSASRFRFFSLISGHKSSAFTRLRTLRHHGKDQSLCNQSGPPYPPTRVDISLRHLCALCVSESSFAISGWSQRYAANPFACHTYKSAPRKSFRCHTYEKEGVGVII